MNRAFLFIDANNLAARCHHAMNELSTRGGIKTGAIMGFMKGLSWCRYKTQIPLRDTVVVWDGGHSVFRKKLYPAYKLGRKLNQPETPEEEADTAAYRAQLRFIKEVLQTIEVRQLQVQGVEADDLIGIFTKLAQQDGNTSIVYSGDGDMHQLHGPGVKIFDPKRELLGWGDIKLKWKVGEVADLLLYKALVGDASDNIKGVAQIGAKRASIVCCFLHAHRTLNRRFNTLEPWKVEVKRTGWDEKDGKWVKKALASQDIIERNFKLMILPRNWGDSPYEDWQAEEALMQWLQPRPRSTRKFIEQLERFELHSILDNLTNW